MEGETINSIHTFPDKMALHVKTSQRRLGIRTQPTCSILIRHTAPVDSPSSTPFCSLRPKRTYFAHPFAGDTLKWLQCSCQMRFPWEKMAINLDSHRLALLSWCFSHSSKFLPPSSSPHCHEINTSSLIFGTKYYKKTKLEMAFTPWRWLTHS